MSAAPARVAILISGRGSNFLALHGAMARGEVPAEVALVLSNLAEAAGFQKARSLRLPTLCVPHRLEPSRQEHESKVLQALEHADVGWVCLAGYMRMLSASFVARYPHRILNIHPSLLPAFPGLDAQRKAVEWGARISGCTVHLVDQELDHGPIVLQKSVQRTGTRHRGAAMIVAENMFVLQKNVQRTRARHQGATMIVAEAPTTKSKIKNQKKGQRQQGAPRGQGVKVAAVTLQRH